MVNELFTLAAHKHVEKGLPGFRLQQWYFFFAAAFFGYGRMLKNNLLAEVAENDWLPGVIGALTPKRRRSRSAAAWAQPYRVAFWARRHARRACCAAYAQQPLLLFYTRLLRGMRRRGSPQRCADVAICPASCPGWSVRHHSFVSYGLYCIGFVIFVLSLKARARHAAGPQGYCGSSSRRGLC